MTRLIKNMYGSELDPAKNALFGLTCGQLRCPSIIHNGGWYNNVGEKLGWGDLTLSDLKRISSELLPGECFIVLGERDSFWNFKEDRASEAQPGTDYIVEHARFAIFPDKIYLVNSEGLWKPQYTEPLDRDALRALIERNENGQ